MKSFQGMRRAAFIIGAALLMSGCASLFDPPPQSWWRSAEVKRIALASEVTPEVHTYCVDGQSAEPTHVAVVFYRMGHAAYYQAFAVPGADAVQVGDTVSVNSVLCQLKVPTK